MQQPSAQITIFSQPCPVKFNLFLRTHNFSHKSIRKCEKPSQNFLQKCETPNCSKISTSSVPFSPSPNLPQNYLKPILFGQILNNHTSIPNYFQFHLTQSYSKILLIFSPNRPNTHFHPQLKHIICFNQFSTPSSASTIRTKKEPTKTSALKSFLNIMLHQDIF